MTLHPAIEQFPYTKRGLTENIILKVVSDDVNLPINDPESFLELVQDFAQAEMVGQQDMCMFGKQSGIFELVPHIKEAYSGIRFRFQQFAQILALSAATSLNADFAETLCAAGSIAIIATSYDEQSLDALLQAGILPLLSEEPVAVGTGLFVKGIRNDVKLDSKDLTAFKVNGGLTPFPLHLPDIYAGKEDPYDLAFLARLLED